MFASLLFVGCLAAFFYSESEACGDPRGFHCPSNGEQIWNCPLPFKNSIDRWRCYEDHCCWCRDRGTNFRRLCTVEDLAVVSEQAPILVNPNFNCNHCNAGAVCAYQETVRRTDGRGFIGPPENGCSFGQRVSQRFNPFGRGKREAGMEPQVDLSPAAFEQNFDITKMQ